MFSDVYNGKKVFVTGHTGFKGSWLCQWLLELGAKVTGFSLDIPTSPSHFEILELNRHIEDRRGDIRSLEQTSNAIKQIKPDLIFHLAAQSLVRPSYQDPV